MLFLSNPLVNITHYTFSAWRAHVDEHDIFFVRAHMCILELSAFGHMFATFGHMFAVSFADSLGPPTVFCLGP